MDKNKTCLNCKYFRKEEDTLFGKCIRFPLYWLKCEEFIGEIYVPCGEFKEK